MCLHLWKFVISQLETMPKLLFVHLFQHNYTIHSYWSLTDGSILSLALSPRCYSRFKHYLVIRLLMTAQHETQKHYL